MFRDYPGLTFDQIHIFLTAAKFENFSKAAKALNITQPTVSKNIAMLEDILGVVLFVRRQKRVQLTNAGSLLAKDFERFFEQITETMDKAYQIQGNQFNTLTVCSPNVLRNNQYLRPVIQTLQEENPQVEVSLEIMDPFKQMDQLIEGSYDVGIVASAYTKYLRENGLIVHSIRKDFPELMISARHPLYDHAKENVVELLSSPIVVVSDENNLFPQWVRGILKGLNLPHGDLTYVSNMDTAVTLLDMGSHIYIGDHVIHFNTMEKIKCIPLKSAPKVSGLSVAYKADSENIFIRKFVSLLEEMGWPE